MCVCLTNVRQVTHSLIDGEEQTEPTGCDWVEMAETGRVAFILSFNVISHIRDFKITAQIIPDEYLFWTISLWRKKIICTLVYNFSDKMHKRTQPSIFFGSTLSNTEHNLWLYCVDLHTRVCHYYSRSLLWCLSSSITQPFRWGRSLCRVRSAAEGFGSSPSVAFMKLSLVTVGLCMEDGSEFNLSSARLCSLVLVFDVLLDWLGLWFGN